MGVNVDRQGRINISLGVVASILVGIPTAYMSTRTALGQQMKEQIREETRPLRDAFTVTLEQNVRSLRNTITAMEFKRDNCMPKPECWTVRDAQDLANARQDLIAAQMALDGIRGYQ